MNVIIIEDELPTAKDLMRTIKSIDDDIEIVAILQTVEDALNYLMNKSDIDLIFSDILLGNQLSFEIFKKVKTNIPVIFCTAYDEYALEAFKANGIDYLLKPFNKNNISKALDKFQSLKEKFNQGEQDLSTVLEKVEQNIRKNKSSILVYAGDKIIPIDITTIALFYVVNKSTFAYTFETKQHLVKENLDYLEEVNKPNFFRTNRQFLINRKAVKDVSQYFNRKLLVNLKIPFNEKIIVSKLRTSDLMKWLTEV